MIDNFFFGYRWGYIVSGCNSNTLIACRADTDSQLPNGTGFQIDGISVDVRFSECQAAGQQYAGVYVATGAGITTCILNSHFWGPDGANPAGSGVAIAGGNVKLSGGVIRDLTYAVNFANASSLVDVDDVTFGANLTAPIQITTAPNSSGGIFVRPTGSSAVVTATASSGTLALPLTGEVVRVTGPSGLTVSSLTGTWPGRRVILFFEVAGTLDPTAQGSNLKIQTGNSNMSFGVGTPFEFVWTRAWGIGSRSSRSLKED